MKAGVMGGGNLPDDSITELDSRFEGSHLRHLACSPLNRSSMAHYVTSFDNHVLSLSEYVVRASGYGEGFHVTKVLRMELCGLFQRH